ncbi:hypothetical protein PIB30_046132 [Stylosanthes scabra]|uniref:TF-B3 domain-containing protein n=1 Tax=Stylosanthes scabra TaxID=79078 RepID=A0ABU6RH38_9FABA|nr:hypothetical protein [Stylosanthes scabra]
MAPRHQQGDPTTTFVRFFKIICHWHIRDEKIKLPTEFTKKCGLKLPNPVILRVTDGRKKKVHWTKINGSIWFIGKEWKEFLEHYSVSHGHLMLFKYSLVASFFEVQIFDNTTLEIDYPHHTHEPHYDDDHVDDDDDGDDSDYDINDDDDNDNDIDDDEDYDDDNVKVHKYDEYQWKDTSESSAGRKSNNPSFEVVMQDSYINGGRCMAIPSNFAREFMKEGDYLLKVVENGRIWKVMFKTWCGYGMPYKKYKLQKGWAKFSQGNKLEKNDVCVFELVPNTAIPTLSVLIQRNHGGRS